jgi:hypothetical protein
VFDHISSRSTSTWDTAGRSFTAGYTNDRKTSGGYGSGTDTFDSAGNTTSNQIALNDHRQWKFDAAGRPADWEETVPDGVNYARDDGSETTFDGDGRAVKKVSRGRLRLGSNMPSFGYTNEYKIYSSVTGKEITTLSDTGEKTKTSVYMNGSVIAEMGFDPGVYHTVQFKHTDPVSGVEAETNVSGIGSNSEGNRTFEGLGAEIPSYSEASAEVPSFQHGGSVLNPEHGCELNGGPVGCDRLGIWLSGLGIQVVGGVIIQETTVSKPNYLKLNNEDELANIFANRGGMFEKHGNEMWFLMSYTDEVNISAYQLRAQDKYEKPTTKQLRERLVQRLNANKGKCRSFLDGVRSQLKIGKTIEDLFDDVAKKGGFIFDPNLKGDDGEDIGGKSHADGNSNAIPLKAQLHKTDPSMNLVSLDRYITVVIHELIHRAGVDSHERFALAAFNSLGESEQKSHPLIRKDEWLENENKDSASSRYFSRLVNEYCRPPEAGK